jgi:citrate lyase beta subunit
MLGQWLESSLKRVKGLPLLPEAPVLPAKLHTFYGGAHLFKRNTLTRLADLGERGIRHFWPTPEALGCWYEQVFQMGEAQAEPEGCLRPFCKPFSEQALRQIHSCLQATAVKGKFIEDYRIDFEDGYGLHAPADELLEAERCARVLAQLTQEASRMPDIGIRLKPFSGAHREHSVRLLGRFFEVLQAEMDFSQLPNFWVTLPKIRAAAEAVDFQVMVEALERALEMPSNSLGVELMFETLEAVRALGQADFLDAWMPALSAGLCVRPTALVLGTFDTCAEWGVAARNQGHQHPLMDFVRLQAVSWGNQIGAHVVDSITRAVTQMSGSARPLVIHGLNVNHSIAMGIGAGWDIHPLQVLARRAVQLASVSHDLDGTLERLKQFLQAQTQASRVGAGFDDLATVRGLVSQVSQAVSLGLISVEQISEKGVQWPPVLTS